MRALETVRDKGPISLYWGCQLGGWALVSVYWAYTVYTRDDYGCFFTLLNYVLDIAIGILLTHSYRSIALRSKWTGLRLRELVIRIIPAIIILAGAFMILANIKWHGYWVMIRGENWIFWDSLTSWEPVFITGLRLMSIWVLAYHLYHYYQREIITAQQNAELSIIAKQAQIDNLSVQLNPHFLFNSLNSIKSLIIENPGVARRAVDLLSDILRSSLYEKDEPFITIRDELALVRDYTELEKLRFEERLNISIRVDSAVEDYMILPLSIQLLVENAIKHGIAKRRDGGSVVVSVIEKETFVQVTVKNPGSLHEEDSEAGIGIKNLTKRLLLQYNGEASFTLTNESSDQVTATLLIPIHKK